MKKLLSPLLHLLIPVLLLITGSCTKEDFTPNPNGLLSGIRTDGEIAEKITYNKDNLVEEVHSRYFYRKFSYNENHKLIREDAAVSTNLLSSSITVPVTELLDPDKAGISAYYEYELNNEGYPIKQMNYFKSTGSFELRSMRSFEYDGNNRISKDLLHDRNGAVTQYYTYIYDKRGNVLEENYYSYILVDDGNPPEHIMKNVFQYDSFKNPFNIFSQTASPGIYSNTNNIIKIKSYNYTNTPGVQSYSETQYVFDYNHQTGFPVRVIDGEEYIY